MQKLAIVLLHLACLGQVAQGRRIQNTPQDLQEDQASGMALPIIPETAFVSSNPGLHTLHRVFTSNKARTSAGSQMWADSDFGKYLGGAARPAAAAPAAAQAASSGGFSHAQKSYFDIELLTSKGPRKNADVGEPHDSTRPLDKDGTLSTGSWWCAAGGWPSPALRATTEVFYVFTGNGCLTDLDGTKHYFGPGDTVILPKGWSGRWDVLEDIHKVWAVTDHPDVIDGSVDPKKAIIKPYSSFAIQDLRPHSLREGATRGSPMEASETWLDNGYMTVGSWTCTPGSFFASNPTTSEAFHILEGEFFLTNAVDGSAQKCKAGDTILLPKGWSGEWDILETVKKVWVVVK